jgi:restriction system protein
MIHFGLLFNNVYAHLWWALPLVLLLALFSSAWFRAMTGKAMIKLAVRLFLDKKVYHLINNITLPDEGESTLFDSIIVSPYGLFVIEANNMKGLISSGEYQEIWTQTVSKSIHRFRSPLHQTTGKAAMLQVWLGLESDKVFPITVFVGDCIFTSPMPDNVIHDGGYIRYIKSKTKPLLSNAEVQQIICQLTKGRLKPTTHTHIQHMSHVQGCMESMQTLAKETATACPRCGSIMILRTVTQGPEAGCQFWSCSTYPKCRMVTEFK